MAYKVHTVTRLLPRKYPKLFSGTKCHKDGTSEVTLVEPTDLSLLLSINHYLEEEGIYIINFQIVHAPKTLKYGREYTLLAENFRNILLEYQRFLPNHLPFDDPITTDEAAALINVHVQYARRLAKTSRFKATKSGGVWYVSEASVVDYRKRKIREVLIYEYGAGMEPVVDMYLKQPIMRLPIKENSSAPIITAFSKWYERNEKSIVRMRRGK